MIGRIKWTIKGQKIKDVSVEKANDVSAEIESSYASAIINVFKDLSLVDDKIVEEERTYEAYLHIQNLSDFFLKIVKPDDGATSLPEDFSFAQSLLLSKPNSKMLPIIHVSSINMIDGEYGNYIHIPRFASIMESSIWNYYFCFKDYYDKEPDLNEKYASDIVQSIANNYNDGLYDLAITHEYADLNARLTLQSFISNQTGHGKFVSPFVFHSEQEMLRQRLKKEDKLKKIQSHSWRILLVDDKWNEELSIVENVNNKKAINKYKIIKSRLEELGFNVINRDLKEKVKNDSPVVYFDCVANVNDTIEEKLPNQKYDIILLDYLLDIKSQSKSVEYGYEVLKRLKEKDSRLRENAPLRRNFFMFISAFTTAVDERLHAEDLTRSEDYWYIGEGACPTNTPEQFKLYLINLMWKRLEDSGINKLAASNIFHLLLKIFTPIKNTSVRKRANEYYRDVLSLQYHYQRLLKDVEMADTIQETKGSVLVTEFISRRTNLGGLLEHLMQLVHITAFGTVRQWPELWEEFIFCKAQLDDVFDEEINRLKKAENPAQQLYLFIKDCLGEHQLTKTEDAPIEQASKLKQDLYQYIEQYILKLRAL